MKDFLFWLKAFSFWLWTTIPIGNILKMNYEEFEITLHKNFWVTIDDKKGALDMIPLFHASPELVEAVERRMVEKYKLV